jgi:hypothetical protein
MDHILKCAHLKEQPLMPLKIHLISGERLSDGLEEVVRGAHLTARGVSGEAKAPHALCAEVLGELVRGEREEVRRVLMCGHRHAHL